jgi:UDP-2,3-diacylglucosamine pyrophosphatase LpxH
MIPNPLSWGMNIKKLVYDLFVSLAIALVFGVLTWILNLHGSLGLLHIDNLVRTAFIVVCCIGLLLIVFVLLRWKLTSSGHRRGMRWFLLPILVLTLLGLILPTGAAVYVSSFPNSAVGDVAPRLILKDNTAGPSIPAVAIVQNSVQPETFSLWYEANGKRTVILEEKPSMQHIFSLTDLQPNTQYAYQITGGNIYHFRMPAADSAGVHFAAGGDAHFGAASNRANLTLRMATQIANPLENFDYFFSLGDLVDMGSSNRQWRDALTSLSSLSSTTLTGYIPGNHDTMFTGLARYKYFCAPDGQHSASDSPLYYRVDSGNVHFLIVDVEWSAESFGPKQAKWLEEQLKSIPTNDWKIVLSHGFYYASGFLYHGWNWSDNPETIAALTPLFEKYKVDIVLSGHLHQLELLQHAGVTYVIAGGLGGILDQERNYVSPASLWYLSGNYGFADVSVKGSEAVIKFRNPDNQVIHSYNLKKN